MTRILRIDRWKKSRSVKRDLLNLKGQVNMTWGQTSHHCQGDVMVLVKALPRDEGEMDHLIQFHAGFPVPPEVQNLDIVLRDRASGEVVHQGKSDRLGQHRVRGLSPGDYEVELTSRLITDYLVPLAMGATGKGSSPNPYNEDGPVHWRCSPLEATQRRMRLLEVRTRPEPIPDPWAPVISFEIADENSEFLGDGLIGIFPDQDYWYGDSTLELLLPEGLSEPIEVLSVGGFRRLTRADAATVGVEDYERAIRATERDGCRQALREAKALKDR